MKLSHISFPTSYLSFLYLSQYNELGEAEIKILLIFANEVVIIHSHKTCKGTEPSERKIVSVSYLTWLMTVAIWEPDNEDCNSSL